MLGLWLLLTGTVSPAEVLAGAGAAALASSVAELAQYQAGAHLRVRLRWLAAATRLPARLISETASAFAALWVQVVRGRRPASVFRTVPERWGGDDPAGSTRRALVVVGMSATPNRIVLGLDEERGVAVVHQLTGDGA
jgi:multisubunit Na+/H+ antiporter MnhE subunit